jgi:uncharacterized protein (TIGR00730 family)
MSDSKKSLCVFCASSDAVDSRYKALAADVGRMAAAQGWRVVYGGAKSGMMGALADGALAAGCEVVGVIPEVLGPQERAHESLTALHIVADMHERQKMMADLAGGFLILPGGLGTLAEFFEILTWKAIGLHAKPIALMNAFGYWDAQIEQLSRAQDESFLHALSSDLFDIFMDLEDFENFFRAQ